MWHKSLLLFTHSAALIPCNTGRVNQHYFSEAPAGDFIPREIEVVLAGAPRSVLTSGGVFSPDHLDVGTRVLLNALTESDIRAAADSVDMPARILDLGCGWGAIALDAALAHPEVEVWAVDVNERARKLTAANAARLGLTNVRVSDPDDLDETLSFTSIRSNPPIRVGKQVLHGILRQWLPRLSAGGSAHLVVAKHLGAESLQRWLAAEMPDTDVSRVARAKGFHVIEVVAPS